MEDCGDFIHWLGADMSIQILMCLDNPSDLVRASAVSSSWRHFVIANGLCKQLCIRMFPEVSSVAHVIEVNNRIEPLQVGHENSLEWSCLEREHKVYAFLARGLTSFMTKGCILEAIVASSTDNYPLESIQHTLQPGDRVDQRASYWSSKGEVDPAVPETLVYKLIANLCVITEIHIHPFQAYFQFGFPIYSASAVRFRLGHLKPPFQLESDVKDECTATREFIHEHVVWTYTSPSFPMAQESRLQKFKLPEPVLCIGGILQIELLGRVQKQEMDEKYYICVSHVQVVGRSLSPAFDVEIIDPSGKCTLKYHPDADYCCSPMKSSDGEASSSPSRFRSFTASIRGWEQMILNTLLGGGAVVIDDPDGTDDEVLVGWWFACWRVFHLSFTLLSLSSPFPFSASLRQMLQITEKAGDRVVTGACSAVFITNISEVVNSMKDLMDFCRETKAGPIEGLKNFPRQTSEAKLQMQKMQEMEHMSGIQGLPTDRNALSKLVGLNSPMSNNSHHMVGRGAPLSGSAQAALALSSYQNLLMRQNSMNSNSHQEASSFNNFNQNASPFQGAPLHSNSNNMQVGGGFSNTHLLQQRSVSGMFQGQQNHQQSLSQGGSQAIQQQMIQQLIQDMSNNNSGGGPKPSLSGQSVASGSMGREGLRYGGITSAGTSPRPHVNGPGGSSGPTGPTRSNSFKAASHSDSSAGGGNIGVSSQKAPDLPHLSDDIVQDIASEFTENGFFNNDELEDGMGYGWKA